MNKKKGLLAILIIFILDLFGTAAMLKIYPQFSIEKEALLGRNFENLKDFSVSEEGLLTSESEDPWIYYPFGEPVNIRFLSVKVSDVQGTETMAQVYLMPSQGLRMMKLKDGVLSAGFGLSQGCINVGGIRLDLATDAGAALRVEKAVINSRPAVILDAQRLLAFAFLIFGLIFAELFGWRRIARERKEKPILLIGAFQAVLKLTLLWIIRKPLMEQGGTDYHHILWWMAFLGLECFCIAALQLGAGRFKKSMLGYHALILPYAFTAFSLAELLSMKSFQFETPEYLLLNICVCGTLPAVFLFLSRRPAVAFSLSALIFTALSAGNHYYGMLRDNPLEYFDIANAGTAVHVISNYTLKPDMETMGAALITVILVIVVFCAFGLSGAPAVRRVFLGNLAALSVFVTVLYIRLPVFANLSNMQIICMEKGYLLSFASFVKMGQIKKPEGYTAKKAEELLKAETEKSEGLSHKTESEVSKSSLPNIIVIMNETLADMPEIYGFKTEAEALPNIHGMKENAVKGKVLVSVYGGGTANTEYEFLTGNSLYYLPVGCSPYVQYMGSEQQSIAYKLRALGYSAAAYHPYLAVSYRRTAAYPLLGMERFYSIEDAFPYSETLRDYISDSADFKNVIHLYEERDPHQPFFLFNVTMQNHGGYSEEEPAVEVTVRPEDEELCSPAFLEYLSLIHESDAAFKELTDYFSGVEEDTIILMFGDHQPSADEKTAAALDRHIEARDGFLDPNRRYYATFIMWANFDIDEEEDVLTSPNYLRSLLLEKAGVGLSPYESFLNRLRESYPAINAFGYMDQEGTWNARGEKAEEALDDYGDLVYNNVFDKKNMIPEYYNGH